MDEPAAPAISVVVCSLNGARTLGACLEALEHQSVRDRAQLIVVDDGSTDDTAGIARRFGVELVAHPVNLGISAARNTGLGLVRAPIVAFTDDDCVPDRRWLEALLQAYRRSEVVGAGGPVQVARSTTLVHRYYEDHPPLAPLELALDRHRSLTGRLALYLQAMWSLPRPSGGRFVYSFAGANMSFRTGELAAVGHFEPGMRFGSDDEYICEKVRSCHGGAGLWFNPDAVVRHDYEGSVADLLRRSFAYGSGHARVFLEQPTTRWPIVFPLPLVTLGGLLLARGAARVKLLLLVHLLLPQGVRGAVRHRRVDALAFTGLRLAEEAAHNAGMLVGLLEHLSPPGLARRRRRDGHRPTATR